MAESDYTKGLPVDSDKEWYHGELTREQAEMTLRDNGSDCFLIRESKESLVLSLIDLGKCYHIKIEYKPGLYKLSGVSKHFKELEDLVSYITINQINLGSDAMDQIYLGKVCKKRKELRNHIGNTRSTNTPTRTESGETSHTYTEGEPMDLLRYHWYHGKMTEEEAEWFLGDGDQNKFLVRQSLQNLVLSMKSRGQIVHKIIGYTHEGYYLKGNRRVFRTLPEMITYYKFFPIHKKQLLGEACDSHKPEIYQVQLTHCDEHPHLRGNYFVKVFPDLYKVWDSHSKPHTALPQWSWHISHIRTIHWESSTDELEVVPGRRSVTGEGSFNFIGRNAFQLYHSMARIMAPHNQFHSNPTSRPIPIPIHGKRGEFFSVRRECAPLRREEHEQARMGWVSAGSPGSLPFLESPPPPPLPNRIHGSRSVECFLSTRNTVAKSEDEDQKTKSVKYKRFKKLCKRFTLKLSSSSTPPSAQSPHTD